MHNILKVDCAKWKNLYFSTELYAFGLNLLNWKTKQKNIGLMRCMYCFYCILSPQNSLPRSPSSLNTELYWIGTVHKLCQQPRGGETLFGPPLKSCLSWRCFVWYWIDTRVRFINDWILDQCTRFNITTHLHSTPLHCCNFWTTYTI